MKTIKYIFIIAGFAVTSLCFGQLFSQSNNDVLYYSAYYNISSNSLEHHLDSYPASTRAGDHFDAPLLSRTYFVPIEYDIIVEDWMTKPFESSYYEEDMQVESWMESPYEWGYTEEGLEVEDWMTRPFELSGQAEELMEEEIRLEAWMSTPWI